MKDSGEFSEEEIRQMWDDFGKKINDCVAVISKIEEEMKSYSDKMKGEASKSSLEVYQINTATKNALSKINSILDKTEKVFNEDRLKHIAENFIRKSLEIKIEKFSDEYFERMMKELSPEFDSLRKHIKYVKKWLREGIS